MSDFIIYVGREDVESDEGDEGEGGGWGGQAEAGQLQHLTVFLNGLFESPLSAE